VMQRHGGELKIESELGKGSRFVLVFPASRVVL
jgi:two-component system phosphate regulon sensor histidine kinase PhoR